MNKHQLIIDTLNKKERAVIPFHLDLTDKVRERLITHFGDPNFEQKVGNSLALERNESFVVLGNNKERDMFGVVWNKDPGRRFWRNRTLPASRAKFRWVYLSPT